MGYSHYFHHRRRFTNDEWKTITQDISAIIATIREEGVKVGDNYGETEVEAPCLGSDPDEGRNLGFNGLEDECCETFVFWQNRKPLSAWQKPKQRGWDFCKTGRAPYDVAVVACLCYLESVFPEKFSASSDGRSKDWQDGLGLARRALPRLGNVLKLPKSVEWYDAFSDRLYDGGKYEIKVTHNGDYVITNEDTYRILLRTSDKDAKEWTDAWIKDLAQKRQAKLPCETEKLYRWEDRQMRLFMQTAPMRGYEEYVPEEVAA